MNYYLDLYCLPRIDREKKILEYTKELLSTDIVYKKNAYMYHIPYPSKPVFVAHMDIVGDASNPDGKLNDVVILNREGVRYLTRSIPSVLGADDLTGVSLILNNLKDINFVFTQFEETGMAGARELFSDPAFLKICEEKKITGFIEFDRYGCEHIIGHNHGYCCKEFSDDIIRIAKEADISYTDVTGLCTDIDHICNKYSAANLSVGYNKQHTFEEYTNLNHLDKCNNLLKLLNEKIVDHTRYKPGDKIKKFNNFSNSNSIVNPFFKKPTEKIKNLPGFIIIR